MAEWFGASAFEASGAGDSLAFASAVGAVVPAATTAPAGEVQNGVGGAVGGVGYVAGASDGGSGSTVGGTSASKRKRDDPEYKEAQRVAAAERRQKKQQRVGALEKRNEELERLLAEQGTQLAALQPRSQKQEIDAAERACAKAGRAAQQARETCARAQASSARLAGELQIRRAEARSAAYDARRAMQEADELRAALNRAEAEKHAAVDHAVAQALHAAELEHRRAQARLGADIQKLELSVGEGGARAKAADARAVAAEAAARAAGAKAKASTAESRQLKEDVRRLKHGAAAMAAAAANDAVGRAVAAMGGCSSDSDSEGGPSGGGGGGGGGGSSSSKCPGDDCAWEDDGCHSLTRPGHKRVSAARPVLRTAAEKVQGMQLATSGISLGQAETLGKCSPAIKRVTQKRFLQRSADNARAVGLCLHGIDLMTCDRLSIKGDGFSDHDAAEGVKEYFTYTHTLRTARGQIIELPLDGFLLSEGLTAKAEAALCERVLAFLKEVMALLLKSAEQVYGEESVPGWFDIDRIDIAGFAHVGADGANAAQCWAREMKDEIQASTKRRIGAAAWATMDALQRERELWVLTSKCGTHGGACGFAWARKAMGKLTEQLGATAVESVRATGHASDHFACSMNLPQALYTGNKLVGSRTGYDHGKSFYLLEVARGEEFRDQEWIQWPRQNGSRMLQSMRMCAPFKRNRRPVSVGLGRLFFHPTLSKVVCSFWSQMHSPLLNLEAGVTEATCAGLAEPAQVLLGQAAFGDAGDGGGGEGGDSQWTSATGTATAQGRAAGDAAPAVRAMQQSRAGDAGAVTAGAKGEQRETLRQGVAAFLSWHAKGGDLSLSAYRAAVAIADRARVAESVRCAPADEAMEVLAACTDPRAALALIDAGEFDEPCASSCGAFQHVDTIVGIIRACRHFAGQPELLFDGNRASARLKPFLPDYATKALEDWEGAVYRVPGRNARGEIVNPSARAAADRWRSESDPLCSDLEADGTRDKYVEAACNACADELERYFKSTLSGELGSGNRSLWQAQKLQGVALNTNGVESFNGTSKQVRHAKVTASHGRIAANVLARRAQLWERWDLLEDKMQESILSALPKLDPLVKKFTSGCQELNAKAELERKQRQQIAAVRAAAQKYAEAQALHALPLWSDRQFKTKLGAFSFKYEKAAALEQQLDIVVTGYGYSELGFQHKKKDAFCAGCGANLGACSKHEHLEQHVLAAIKYTNKEGRGKPEHAPLPSVTIKEKNFAPVLREDQSKNPLHTALAELSEQAKKMAPRFGVTIAPQIAFGTKPPANDELVGKCVEYVFRIAAPGARKAKSQLYTYCGRIVRAEVVSAGTTKEHVLADCIWPTTLVDGVFVEEEEKETCMLFPKHYASRKENGWVVYDGRVGQHGAADADTVDLTDDSLATKMDVAAMESAMLCAPITMG